MLFFLILTLLLQLSISGRYKRHVENSALPLFYKEPTYNISRWVKVLNLQQCVFVEIGENFCAVFVEVRARKVEHVEEYFLGVCDLDTIYKWRLCSVALEKRRPRDCRFRKEGIEVTDVGARVHRRLCDVTGLSFHADHCNCKATLGNQKLRPVAGFPTCFLSPLPESICFPKNVCGTNKCYGTTVLDQVHSIHCDENCMDHQPFCEELGMRSSLPPKIESYWSDWRKPDCNGPCLPSQFNILEAECIHSRTGKGAIDCLGPGTSCCPADIERCRCNVFVEDAVLKVIRQFYRDKEPDLAERDTQIDYYLDDQRSPISYFRELQRNTREKYPEEFEKYAKNMRNYLKFDSKNRDYKKVFDKNSNRIKNYFLTKFLRHSTQIPLNYENYIDDTIPIMDFTGIGSVRRKREKTVEEYSDDDDDISDEEYEDSNAEDVAIEKEVGENTETTVSTTEDKEKEEIKEALTTEDTKFTKKLFEEDGEDRVNNSKLTHQSSSGDVAKLMISMIVILSVFLTEI
ncbi:uncharacterized protein LOC108742893 [Agrilus planipennis]|uniref:Uncharacterized protein LOC108742893 n=1 Tax=Agrilus planipennis TaxID=224129 RepID=A0A1W4XMN8_AGRPL|nr:uncharacterized protein LOC108742893 [Agrilus planipennis]